MAKLMESSSSSESESESENEEGTLPKNEKLTINKKYAKDFEYRKQTEELTMYNNNDGSDDDSSSSSESEVEEEDISKDIHFLETMKAIREKDAIIYESNVQFFPDDDADDESDENVKEKKEKPMKIKDVLRREILDQMDNDEAVDPTLSDDEGKVQKEERGLLMYDEEQQRIRNELLKEASEGLGENDDILFEEKKGKKLSSDKVELLQKGETLMHQLQQDSSKALVDPRGEVANGDTFLLDYISKKRWNDEDSLADLENQEEFESKYNFRFEEQQNENINSDTKAHIATYSRNVPSSLRRDDESRKAKRLAKKQRKEEEKRQKQEMLKRLKNAKKAELKRRIKMIQEAAGPDNAELSNMDEEVWDEILCQDDDFDDEKLQSVMNKVFGDDYYENQQEHVLEDKKDILRGMDDIIVDQEEDDDVYEEDNDLEEDTTEIQEESYEETYEDYSNVQQMNQNKVVQQKIQDELYKLDYEDMIEDIPCRFKYKKVTPNDYGISPEEILMSKDATLRQFVSMKKLAPYQPTAHDFDKNNALDYNPGSRKRQKFRDALKEDYQDYLEQQKLQIENNKAKNSTNPEDDDDDADAAGNSSTKKRRRRQKKKSHKKDIDASVSTTNNLEAKDKNLIDDQTSKTSKPTLEQSTISSTSTSETKKRKRHKSKREKSSTTSNSNNELPVSKPKKKKKSSSKRKSLENGIDVSSSRLASYGL